MNGLGRTLHAVTLTGTSGSGRSSAVDLPPSWESENVFHSAKSSAEANLKRVRCRSAQGFCAADKEQSGAEGGGGGNVWRYGS